MIYLLFNIIEINDTACRKKVLRRLRSVLAPEVRICAVFALGFLIRKRGSARYFALDFLAPEVRIHVELCKRDLVDFIEMFFRKRLIIRGRNVFYYLFGS